MSEKDTILNEATTEICVNLKIASAEFKLVLILMFCACAKLPDNALVVNTTKMRFFSTGFLVDSDCAKTDFHLCSKCFSLCITVLCDKTTSPSHKFEAVSLLQVLFESNNT